MMQNPTWGGEGDAAIGGNAPNPEPDRSAGTVSDDSSITAKVKTRLVADSIVSGMKIDVDTRSGVVYLTGDNMNSQATTDQAIKLSNEIVGVKNVVSKLAIEDVKN
jgi:hyperosmotically inducible periplasmic protein